MSAGQTRSADTTPRWVGLVLFLIPLVLYAKVADHGFLETYDDGSYVTENPRVRDGFSTDGIVWSFTEAHSANWHPLTWLSHMLDCQVFGLDAGKHHLVSVFLHALATLLCYRALTALTGVGWSSALVALIFAVHPLRVESVAWVAERKDVLSGVFFFWMLLAYARYREEPTTRGMGKVALALGLGLMSKPMLVSGPAVLCLWDLWPRNEKAPTRPGTGEADLGRTWFLEKWPLWLLVAVSSLVTVLAQRSGGAIRTLESITLVERLANTPLSYVEYLGRNFWPQGLAFYYPHPAIVDPGSLGLAREDVIVAALALLVVTVLFVRLRHTRPWLMVGWLWYLGMLVPVIGLLQVGSHRLADRYTYLPLVGIYVLLVWEARARLAGARPAVVRTAWSLALALALAFAARTRAELDFWREEEPLYERAIAVTENNWTAHSNLGLLVQKRATERIARGELEEGRRELEEARNHYLRVLEITPNQADVHNNLGGIHLTLGESAAAARQLEFALTIRPTFLEALLTRGLLHELAKDPPAAERMYRRALEAHPDEAAANYKLGDALHLQGRDSEAAEAYRQALRLDRLLPELQILRASCLGLVWAMATSSDTRLRDPLRAAGLVEVYQRARGGRLQPRDLRIVAAVQAANGQLQQAIATAQRALSSEPAVAADLEEYRAGRALYR